jgi:hypothetical protein
MLCMRQNLPRVTLMVCALLVSGSGSPSALQEKEEVAPFKLISLLLTAFISEQACQGVTVDQDALSRFLANNGITAAQLSSKGPYGAEVVSFRARLRRQFRRHNAEFCDRSLAMFGPEGTDIRGLLSRP